MGYDYWSEISLTLKSTSAFYLGIQSIREEKLRTKSEPYPTKRRADLGTQKALLNQPQVSVTWISPLCLPPVNNISSTSLKNHFHLVFQDITWAGRKSELQRHEGVDAVILVRDACLGRGHLGDVATWSCHRWSSRSSGMAGSSPGTWQKVVKI